MFIPDQKFSIPDPRSKRFQIPYPHQRIYVFLTLKTVPKFPDPGVKKAPDPGSGSAILESKYIDLVYEIDNFIGGLRLLLERGSPRVGCVPDSCHIGTDPDPWIRTLDLRIRIQILLFSSVTSKANRGQREAQRLTYPDPERCM
jgi:hypothetical protein